MTAVKTQIGARDDAYQTKFAPTSTIAATDVQRAIEAVAALSGTSGANVTISTTAPLLPDPGDLWWNSETGSLFVYYNDGNSSQWVVANGSDNAALPAGGTSGQVLAKSSSTNYDVAWTNSVASITYVVDGGGAPLTSGMKGFLEVPFNCVIVSNRVFADQAGTIAFGVYRDSYANFPPTVGDVISGVFPPSLVAAQSSQDTTLTGWSTSLSAGDVLAFELFCAGTTITLLTLSLVVRKV